MYVHRRIPVNPASQHNRDRRHTPGPVAAETARSGPLGRYHPVAEVTDARATTDLDDGQPE